MAKFYQTQCCGLMEIASLNHHMGKTPTAEDNLVSLWQSWAGVDGKGGSITTYGSPPPFVVFEDIERNIAGEAFAEYLDKHNLGYVYRSRRLNNPIHGTSSNLRVYVWEPDWKAFQKKAEGLIAANAKAKEKEGSINGASAKQ